MLIYATSADLTTWGLDPIPANANSLLRTASLLVRKATKTTFYPHDDTGLPTESTTLQAFKDATCAHAAAMNTANLNPLAGGVLKAGAATSNGVGSANIAYADADAAAAARARLAVELAPEAVEILLQAGVTPAAPWVVG